MLDKFISGISAVFDFCLSVIPIIWSLFVSHPVFMAVLVLWALDKVFNLFDLLKG